MYLLTPLASLRKSRGRLISSSGLAGCFRGNAVINVAIVNSDTNAAFALFSSFQFLALFWNDVKERVDNVVLVRVSFYPGASSIT